MQLSFNHSTQCLANKENENLKQVHRGFCWGQPESVHLEDLGIDDRIILKVNLQEVGWGSMDWIGLTQYRDRWQALVKAVMNLQVP
jgi:hypothetical protein